MVPMSMMRKPNASQEPAWLGCGWLSVGPQLLHHSQTYPPTNEPTTQDVKYLAKMHKVEINFWYQWMPYLKFRTFVDSNQTYNQSAKCSKRCFNESKNCQKLKLKWYKAEESSHTTLHLFLSTAVFKNALNSWQKWHCWLSFLIQNQM